LGSRGRRFFFEIRGVMSLLISSSIHQPFAFNSFQAIVGSLLVVDFQRGTMVVAKIKFGEVALQVLFAAVLVRADHAALEHAKNTCDGVRMGFGRAPIP
jgi:hypothetical protein